MTNPEQSFPRTDVDIQAGGVVISVHLAIGTTFSQAIPAPLMDRLCQQWQASRKTLALEQQLIEQVRQSKV